MSTSTLQIVEAHSSEYIPEIRTLFEAYETSLDTDLCFQQFEQELAMLPGDYAPPPGCLLIALDGENYAGCVALRKIESDICEMKRLFVDPAFRGQGVGIRLIQEVIARAKQRGYKEMRLDTLPSMVQAISLYRSLGFVDIEPYRNNPVAGVRYMTLDLSTISIE